MTWPCEDIEGEVQIPAPCRGEICLRFPRVPGGVALPRSTPPRATYMALEVWGAPISGFT